MKASGSFKAYRQQVEKLMAELGQGVEAICTSEQWAQVLRFLSRFYTYSWFNAALISMQCPYATHVKGFQAWKAMGRHVRRGERSIKIMAPRVETERNPKTGEEEEVVTGFRVVHVFDVSQTDGPPIPEIPERTRPTGRAAPARSFYSRLKKVIPVPVTEGDTGRADGVYNIKTKQITIKQGLPMSARAITLIHEYAHALLHNEMIPRSALKYAETVAEGVAYIVARYFGLEPGKSSFEYIALWSRDKELVWTVGPQIQRTAEKIIRQLLAAEAKQPKRAGKAAAEAAAALRAGLPVDDGWVTIYRGEDWEDADIVCVDLVMNGLEARVERQGRGHGVQVRRGERDRARQVVRKLLLADEVDVG